MSNKYLLILLLFSVSCNLRNDENSNATTEITYDFEVLYRFQGEMNNLDDKYRNKISSDSLYFIIESNFRNDTIVIESDKKEVYRGIVNTEPSSGVAEGITIGDIGNIDDLMIRINTGPPINFMLIKKEHNIIGIRKQENKVSILFYKKVPVFY